VSRKRFVAGMKCRIAAQPGGFRQQKPPFAC